MREFKQVYDDFKVVETKSGILFWRRVQARSLWCSVHTQQMVALAEKGDWMSNDAMKAQVIEHWSGITQTKRSREDRLTGRCLAKRVGRSSARRTLTR